MDGASGGVTFNITNQASDLVQTQQSYDPETRTVELAITAVGEPDEHENWENRGGDEIGWCILAIGIERRGRWPLC